MSTHFSIGEFSKLHNISVQTLRYYDSIGLLKPAIINEDSKYRYYTINQFVKVDLIKNFKSMGLDLESIKRILGSEIDNEELLQIIRTQKEDIDRQIRELEEKRSYMSHLENNISQFIKCNEEDIFIVENEKRHLYKYDCRCNNIEELEFNLRRIVLDMESNNKAVAGELIYCVDYDELLKGNMSYNAILINTYGKGIKLKADNVVLEGGTYLTMYYNDSYENSYKYYEKLLKYIEDNDIKVKGDFYETCIMAKVDDEGEEKSLEKIEVLIE